MFPCNRKSCHRVIVASILVGAVGLWVLYRTPSPVDASFSAKPASTPRKAQKYSEFAHETKAHQLECSSCHKFPSDNWKKVRPEAEAFEDITDYPRHDSCVNCHREQFFKGKPPEICSICHTDPGPGNSTRHPFPNPREIYDLSKKGQNAASDFVVGFPHDKHIDIVSAHERPRSEFIAASFFRESRRAEESCSVCHKTMSPQGDSSDEFLVKKPDKIGDGYWLKKGTFKSVPLGHTTCFTCHSAESGILPAPQTCSACHKLKPSQPAVDFNEKLAGPMGATDKAMLDRWRSRDASGTFRHEWFSHADTSCATCHNVLKMNTADPLTKKVNISACSTCHATPTLDDGGVLNFEMAQRKKNARFECVKCHIVFGRSPVPSSHTKALADAGK